jgi:hypothetical protein
VAASERAVLKLKEDLVERRAQGDKLTEKLRLLAEEVLPTYEQTVRGNNEFFFSLGTPPLAPVRHLGSRGYRA